MKKLMTSHDPAPRRGAPTYLTLAHRALAAVLFGWAVLSLPAAAQDDGQPDEISGELELLHEDDFRRGRATQRAFVHDAANGDMFELDFPGRRPSNLRTGDQITVRGQIRGRRFTVDDLSVDARAGGAGPDGDASADLAAPSGVRTAAVIIVDFNTDGDPEPELTGKPNDPNDVADYMFNGISHSVAPTLRSVKDLYQASSFFDGSNGMSWDGQVIGPVTIDMNPSGNCDYYGWARAAERIVQFDLGIDLRDFQHHVFMLPTYSNLKAAGSTCGWAGVANLGCNRSETLTRDSDSVSFSGFCRSWIAEDPPQYVLIHELGHNVEMHHASTDLNNDGTVDSEYGDRSDPMGSSRKWLTFNAPHADQMGWSHNICDVATNNTYTVWAMDIDPASLGGACADPQALKIDRGDGHFYYFSFRQPVGYDNALSSPYDDRTNVHRYRDIGLQGSCTNGCTMFLQSLGDNESFADAANGITVTQTGSDLTAGYVTLEVNFGCATVDPTVALSPSTRTVGLDTATSFDVTVTNNDGASCADSTFNLSQQLSAGDPQGDLSAPSVYLAPGASDTVYLDFAGQSQGDEHVIVVQADDAAHLGQGSGTLIIDGTGPSQPDGLAASIKRKTEVRLSWNASSDNASGVAGYEVYRADVIDGVPGPSSQIGFTSSTNLTDAGTVSGASYDYSVVALDNAGNLSVASAPLRVTVGGKGGDDGGGGNKGGGRGGGPKNR